MVHILCQLKVTTISILSPFLALRTSYQPRNAQFQVPLLHHDISFTKEVLSLHPEKHSDWESIATKLSTIFSSEGMPFASTVNIKFSTVILLQLQHHIYLYIYICDRPREKEDCTIYCHLRKSRLKIVHFQWSRTSSLNVV